MRIKENWQRKVRVRRKMLYVSVWESCRERMAIKAFFSEIIQVKVTTAGWKCK